MKLHAKIWMTHDGKGVFGKGRADLLDAVEMTGSLSGAARHLGMSYRHAWSLIKATEERLRVPLLVRSKGGARGGGAQLTDTARAMLATFRDIELGLSEFTQTHAGQLDTLSQHARKTEAADDDSV